FGTVVLHVAPEAATGGPLGRGRGGGIIRRGAKARRRDPQGAAAGLGPPRARPAPPPQTGPRHSPRPGGPPPPRAPVREFATRLRLRFPGGDWRALRGPSGFQLD